MWVNHMPGIPLQWIHGHPNFLGSNQQQGRNFNFVAVKHECGTRGAAPASNTARRGDARGTPLPTCSAVSCHVAFVFFKLTRTDAASTQADLRWIELYRPKPSIQVEIQKKKKKVQNAPFEQNIKPSFSSLHTNTPNSALCLSLSLSLTRLSLSLCFLPLSLLAVRQSASAESITWLTSVHSFFSSLSRILNLGNDIKLSILVWSLICDLWFVNLS